MRATSDITTFDFRYLRGGQVTFGKRHGAIGPAALTLDDTEIPYERLLETTTRADRLILVLGEGVEPGPRLSKFLEQGRWVAVRPAKLDARQLERAIDRRASSHQAELRRQDLIARGMEHLVRTVTCPVCKATVDLSGLDPTRYTYCPFCESVFGQDSRDVTDGRRYRTCDECGLFDRIQQYPEFYFYFLLVVYGFSYKQRFLCDSCAHRLFLKALAINLIFLLGVPTAVWVKVKSLRGREPSFAALADGNSLARGGRYREAAPLYAQLLKAHPDHPAILMNQALGHLEGGDQAGAAQVLARSVAACNNYLPALQLLEPAAQTG
jgi:hypothetical protein